MAHAMTVRAIITKIAEGYSVRMRIWEYGRSSLLMDQKTAGLPEAEAVAELFAAQNRIP
jgi:hypothetical protein